MTHYPIESVERGRDGYDGYESGYMIDGSFNPDDGTMPANVETLLLQVPWSSRSATLVWVALQSDLATERRLAQQWQTLAGRYDDVRDWLRACPDTPEGHSKFYREASALIFPDAQDSQDDVDD